MITSERSLLEYIDTLRDSIDAIVIEGYDGVGKGRVLNLISEHIGVTPYRPDYNLWQRHDHRYSDRWKVSGFFWDVYSHFFNSNKEVQYHLFRNDIMLFDRGVMSGAVYNNDITIAEDYKKMLKDMKVLHILVICSEEDYATFADIRGASDNSSYRDYLIYTDRFRTFMQTAEVDYILYYNKYNPDDSSRLAATCEGCGHYSYGYCTHPDKDCKVEGSSPRCELSGESEVQDRYVTEMH